MHCVITMSTKEGVKTQLVVYKGQAFNIRRDPQFSLQRSWTYNLTTSAEFMSHWPVENINQSLPEAHRSIAANPANILSFSKHWLSFKKHSSFSVFLQHNSFAVCATHVLYSRATFKFLDISLFKVINKCTFLFTLFTSSKET